MGNIGTFSFQQSKLMTAGEGGMIVTNDEELERLARSVHDCGRMPDEWFYAHFIYGSNYRLSEWQGAILSQQLRRFDAQAVQRSRNAAYLNRALAEIEGITPQALDSRCTRHGHYAYIFHYDQTAFANVPAQRFIEALNAEGIPTQASYPPLHQLAVFQSGEYRKRLCPEQRSQHHAFIKAEFSNTVRAAWETVWLTHPVLLGNEEQIAQVVEAIKKIQGQAAALIG